MIALVELLELSTVLRILGKLDDLPLAEAVVSLLRWRINQVPRAGILFLSCELTSLLEHIASEGCNPVLVKDQDIRSDYAETPELNEIEY